MEEKTSLLQEKLINDFNVVDETSVNLENQIEEKGLLNSVISDTASLGMSEQELEEEKQRTIDEHNKRIMQSPEYKAEMVYQNYIKNTPNYFSGKQKRMLKRQFLRDAKAGKFDYLFDEEKIRKREERQRAKFEDLNKKAENTPKVNTNFHTVDEIPTDVQETLKEFANSSDEKTE